MTNASQYFSSVAEMCVTDDTTPALVDHRVLMFIPKLNEEKNLVWRLDGSI